MAAMTRSWFWAQYQNPLDDKWSQRIHAHTTTSILTDVKGMILCSFVLQDEMENADAVFADEIGPTESNGTNGENDEIVVQENG